MNYIQRVLDQLHPFFNQALFDEFGIGIPGEVNVENCHLRPDRFLSPTISRRYRATTRGAL